MTYVGKFIDRNPDLRAAGVSFGPLDGAGDALKVYSKEEVAEDILKAKCQIKAKIVRNNPVPRYPIIPSNCLGDVLNPELQKSRFVAFREKFTEDLYFKKPQLGKVYELQSKPDYITNENTTFGQATPRSESAYTLVLPKKSPDEVNTEYLRWHDKYLLSHKHYFPSERINRYYDPKYFNPHTTFGICTANDVTGENVRRCLVNCNRLILINKAQKGFLERSMGRLGRSVAKPNLQITPEMTFGVRSRTDECDVQGLIEYTDPCVCKRQLIDAISHINKWRHILFKRVDFHMHDLKVALEGLDPGRTGYLSLSDIYRTARSLLIRLDKEKLYIVLKHFDMILDNCQPTERVDYMRFWKLLTIQFPMPSAGNITDVQNNDCQKETTYRQLCKDMDKELVSANSPSQRSQKSALTTTARELIQPDIPMKFGLNSWDFEQPRSKEVLHRIFKTVLPDRFDDVWQKAQEQFKPPKELLSVSQLRTVMNSVNNASNK